MSDRPWPLYPARCAPPPPLWPPLPAAALSLSSPPPHPSAPPPPPGPHLQTRQPPQQPLPVVLDVERGAALLEVQHGPDALPPAADTPGRVGLGPATGCTVSGRGVCWAGEGRKGTRRGWVFGGVGHCWWLALQWRVTYKLHRARPGVCIPRASHPRLSLSPARKHVQTTLALRAGSRSDAGCLPARTCTSRAAAALMRDSMCALQGGAGQGRVAAGMGGGG